MNISPLTPGDVRAALGGAEELVLAVERIFNGTATLADDEVIADGILSAVAFLDPPTAPLIAIAKVALHLYLAGAAAGLISGDPNPIQDGQTDMPRHGDFHGYEGR